MARTAGAPLTFAPAGALASIHDRLWDPTARLVRVPGHELHLVRESALGAFADLAAGRGDRAVEAIGQVLAQQYRETARPWSGTFKVTAEEARPSEDAIAWLHYDPNWRQFLGVILAHTIERFETLLPADMATRMADAVIACVDGEPPDRIPRWYTNPALLHAWLTGWVGRRAGRAELVRAADRRAAEVMARLDRYGDVDEYNSPTYDGIDLYAAALWAGLAPTEAFAAGGVRLLQTIGARLGTLFHPGLGAICGPYIRAYGVDLGAYVSLAGLWLALAGAGPGVVPADLTERTPHVHDLFFAPLFEDLAELVVAHLRIEQVRGTRDHEQAFRDVHARSLLTPSTAIGCEHGRLPTFARDQYVPFTAHTRGASLGVMLGGPTRSVDAVATSATTAELLATAQDDTVELVVAPSAPLQLDGRQFRCGPVTLTASSPPVHGPGLRWHAREVQLTVAIAD